MTPEDFLRVSQLAQHLTGIQFGPGKREMLYARLARRMRALQIESLKTYCELVETPDSGEFSHFINAITTNLTTFFREPEHFEFLRHTALVQRLACNAQNRRLRLWSAGCSTGEEAYSMAMVVKTLAALETWDCRILATDLDSDALSLAEQGVYDSGRLTPAMQALAAPWMQRHRTGGMVRIKPALRQLIAFKRLNLLEDWPMKGPFDIVFCRNVVIYFSKETQRQLFERMADLIAQDGYLFVGRCEYLLHVTRRFRLVGQAIYQKIT